MIWNMNSYTRKKISMFNPRDRVRVTKVAESDNPIFRTAKTNEWKEGDYNPGLVPPVKYTNEGIIWVPPEIGKPFKMFRTKRGNIEANDYFATSVVTFIEETEEGYFLYTENSVYKMEYLGNIEEDKRTNDRR